MTSSSEWFVESATPRPDLRAWYVIGGELETFGGAPVMAVERLYPTDRNGHRIPGSDWLESRISFHDTDSSGSAQDVTEISDFYALLPADEPPEKVRADYAAR